MPTDNEATFSGETIQRARITTKLEREEADLKVFQESVQEQVRSFTAQANAEIAARAGRINAYKELLGLMPETDTSAGGPPQNGQEGPQEGPGRTETAEPAQHRASAA